MHLCQVCNSSFAHNYLLKKHLTTKKHLLAVENNNNNNKNKLTKIPPTNSPTSTEHIVKSEYFEKNNVSKSDSESGSGSDSSTDSESESDSEISVLSESDLLNNIQPESLTGIKSVVIQNKGTNLHNLIHVSDIHIYCDKRHDEYKQIFDKFITDIKLLNIPDCGIVITGDLLDNKNKITPEEIILARDFIYKLSKLHPVFIIAGNHDKNLNYYDKEDNISAIVSNSFQSNSFDSTISNKYILQNDSQIYYLKKTGIYTYNNISFGVSSVFDYVEVPSSLIKNNEYKIALYHGGVGNYSMYNGKYASDVVQQDKSRPLSCFDGYDYALLGDIHKSQFLKLNIGYAGSMIQKNHGEDWYGHGYLVWNLKTKEVIHKTIKNDYRFVSICIIDGKLMTELNDIPYNLYVKWDIKYNSSKNVDEKTKTIELQNELRKKYNIIEEKYIPTVIDNKIQKYTQLEFDLNLPKQNEYMEEWLKSENKMVPDSDFNKMKELNKKYNDDVKDTCSKIYNWKLIDLSFENLFCYKNKQIINFENMNGVHGIIAPNNTGKSAIFDVLLFALFGRSTRNNLTSYSDLIHVCKNGNSTKTFNVSLNFSIIETGEVYNIVRYLSGSTKGSHIKVSISKNKVVMYNGTTGGANKEIEKLIGTYEDFMTMTVFAQNNLHNFIMMGGKEQKDFIARIFQLDLYEKMLKLAKKDLADLKVNYKISCSLFDSISSKKPQQQIDTNQKLLNQCKQDIDILQEKIDFDEEMKKEYEQQIKQLFKYDSKETLDQLNKSKLHIIQTVENLLNENDKLIEQYSIEYIDTDFSEECDLTNDDMIKLYHKYISLDKTDDKTTHSKLVKSIDSQLNDLYKCRNNLKTLRNLDKSKSVCESSDNIKTINNYLVSCQKDKENIKIYITNKKNTLKKLIGTNSDSDSDTQTGQLKILSESIKQLSQQKILRNSKFEQFNESLAKSRYSDYQNEQEQINNDLDKIKLDNSDIEQINSIDLSDLSTKYLREKISICKDDLNSQKIKLNKNENEKLRIQKQLDDIQTTKEKLKKHEYNINCKYCCNNPFIKKAESEIQNETTLQKQLDTINENIQSDKNKIKLYETIVGLFQKIEIKYNKKIEITKNSEVVQNELTAYMEYKNNMEKSNEADKQIINIENEIKEIQNKLKLKTEIENNIENVLLQFDIFVSQINSIQRLVDELDIVQKNIDNNKIISNKLIILKQFYKNISTQFELQNELKVITDKINILVSNQTIEKHNFEINKHIQNLNSTIKQSNTELTKLQKTETELLITIKNNEELLNELNQERDKTNTLANQVNLLSLYCDMCNYNGISNYLSKKILLTIEQTTSAILAKYSNLKINLIDDDSKELNIKIYRNNVSTGIHAKMLCGSEKFLVELAFRVSLNSLSSISKPNFMICDEGWACLDEITRNNLNFILSAILEHTDYILTVSHIDDVKTWMNKSIYIEIKNNEHFIIQ